MKNRGKIIRFLFIGIVVWFLTGFSSAQIKKNRSTDNVQRFHKKIKSVELVINPQTYEGEAPLKVTLKGIIKVNTPCTVKYIWDIPCLYPPGPSSTFPVETVFVNKQVTVKKTKIIKNGYWDRCKDLRGYLLVLSPERILSNRIDSNYSITFYIVDGFSTNCVKKGNNLFVMGAFSPITAPGTGTARVRATLAGHGIHVHLPILTYRWNKIQVRIPNDPRIKVGFRYYIGFEKKNCAYWLSNINKMIKICPSIQK